MSSKGKSPDDKAKRAQTKTNIQSVSADSLQTQAPCSAAVRTCSRYPPKSRAQQRATAVRSRVRRTQRPSSKAGAHGSRQTATKHATKNCATLPLSSQATAARNKSSVPAPRNRSTSRRDLSNPPGRKGRDRATTRLPMPAAATLNARRSAELRVTRHTAR